MYKLSAFVLDLSQSAVARNDATASGLVASSTTPQVSAGFANNMKYPKRLLVAAALSLLAVSYANAQARFYGVGDPPGGGFCSEIRDATKVDGVIYAVGSGTVVTDLSNPPRIGDTGILWRSNAGITTIPNLANAMTGPNFVSGRAITPDGAFIAGSVWAPPRFAGPNPLYKRVAVRVNVTTSGLTSMDLGSAHYSATNAISSDGSVLYGWHPYSTGSHATRYEVSSPAGPTTIIPIPFLQEGDNNALPAPRGTSANGNIMLGNSSNDAVTGGDIFGLGNNAFIYNHADRTVSGIPYLNGGTWNIGLAVNPAGTLFLLGGDSSEHPNGEHYLYDGGTTTSLGSPNNALLFGNFAGMSADGSVVAVTFSPPDAPPRYYPDVATTEGGFVHNGSGWHDIYAVAAASGADLTGWSLLGIFGISPDGTLLFGNGMHNGNAEGWVAEFPANYLRNYGDITPPTITVPATITVDATSPSGAVVDYVVTATDTVDPNPTGSCAPATGSTFPMGTTVVNCTASDASGNSATANFTVMVTAPPGQILNLIASVNSLNIASGIADSLQAKLQNALDALDAVTGRSSAAACNMMSAFVNEVQAQSGKALTPAQANQLIAAATQLKASLGCG